MRSLHSWDNSGVVNGSSDPGFAFRAEQLEFRQHEIYLAYSAFRRLVLTGERGDLRSVDESPLDWESWTGDWVRCDEDVSLVGHSFGGATLVSRLLFHLSRRLLT
jgi:platelet-activating factor acetylhydrolase